jgi:hypothetical protein
MDIKFIPTAASQEGATDSNHNCFDAHKNMKALLFYITSYICKREQQLQAILPLIAGVLRKYEDATSDRESILAQQKSKEMLTKCVMMFNNRTEIAGSAVATTLLNLPMHYTPVKFQPLLTFQILQYFAEMNNGTSESSIEEDFTILCNNNSDITEEDYNYKPSDADTDNYSTDDGQPSIHNQRVDYVYRPYALETTSLYQFISQFYKVTIKKKFIPNDEPPQTTSSTTYSNTTSCSATTNISNKRRATYNDNPNKKARRDTPKVASSASFLSEHPQHSTHVLRRREVPSVPTIIGPLIPSYKKQPEQYAKYVLLLFKPWRTFSDLKTNPTWLECYDTWLPTASSYAKDHINNINLLNDGFEEVQSRHQACRHSILLFSNIYLNHNRPLTSNKEITFLLLLSLTIILSCMLRRTTLSNNPQTKPTPPQATLTLSPCTTMHSSFPMNTTTMLPNLSPRFRNLLQWVCKPLKHASTQDSLQKILWCPHWSIQVSGQTITFSQLLRSNGMTNYNV